MKLVLNEFLSLDGVMQGPGAVDEDRSDGFDRGGWIVPFATEESWGQVVDGWFRRVEIFLLGRTTYDMMYGYWSRVTDPDNLVATKLNTYPKYVSSSSMTDPAWANTTVLPGDPVKAVAELKVRDGGELQVHGSWRLAKTLHEAGLVDEYRLLTFPVAVGTGKRLFTDTAPATGFTVLETRALGSGITYHALTPAPYAQGDLDVVDGQEAVTDA
ncbi:dihydrofolate reductase family protein [Jiangella asiatica]|uniref:Dihydrofolate reductase n=1 Tax=Jiangella asiatica TaxID=2530372 RepID=A0A4R5D9L2_9ACTN|nr:dihydrofolate reductase family protein [Jiangella asiatica]TDE08441.1 dihydrofolate reductase [Jiangella asiatica]